MTVRITDYSNKFLEVEEIGSSVIFSLKKDTEVRGEEGKVVLSLSTTGRRSYKLENIVSPSGNTLREVVGSIKSIIENES